MKKNFVKTLNALFAFIVTIFLMRKAYYTWNEYGGYNHLSFFVSLIIHGGIGFLIYLGLNCVLKNIGKNKRVRNEIPKPAVRRVLIYSDLKYHLNRNFWNSIYVVKDDNCLKSILLHLYSLTDIKCFISSHSVSFVGESKELGTIKCCFRKKDFSFFEFGVCNSGNRFDILFYSKELREWLENTFKDCINDYDKSNGL